MAEGKIIYCDELCEGIVIGFNDNLIVVGTKKPNKKATVLEHRDFRLSLSRTYY